MGVCDRGSFLRLIGVRLRFGSIQGCTFGGNRLMIASARRYVTSDFLFTFRA